MEPWVPFASIAMGIATVAIIELAKRFLGRGRLERRHAKYQERLRLATFDLVDAHFHVAVCQQRLDQALGDIPVEFEHPLFVASQLGYQVERAVKLESERLGLSVPKVMQSVQASVVIAEDKQSPAEKPVETKETEPASGTGVQQVSSATGLEWQNGKLIPWRPRKVK
jgi:hypothetical protein